MHDDELELPPADVVRRSEVTPVVADLPASAVGTQVTAHFPVNPSKPWTAPTCSA